MANFLLPCPASPLCRKGTVIEFSDKSTGPGFHLLLTLLGEYLLGAFWKACLATEKLHRERKHVLFREEGVGLVV